MKTTTVLPAHLSPADVFTDGFKYAILSRYSPGGRSFLWALYELTADDSTLPAALRHCRSMEGSDYAFKVIQAPVDYWPAPLTLAQLQAKYEAARTRSEQDALLRLMYEHPEHPRHRID